MAAPSKSLVRQAAAPPVPADYRVDLTHGSLAGLLSAGVAVAFLIFLSGLVIGVRLNLEVAEATSVEGAEAVAASEAATAAEGSSPAATAVDPMERPIDSIPSATGAPGAAAAEGDGGQ